MLVLHRNQEDAVTLLTPDGYEIEVKVVSLQRGGVRLGFTADPAVVIARTELVAHQPPIVRKLLRKPRLAPHSVEKPGT